MSGDTSIRHALVTGGSRGIGRAVALALAEAGCDVTLTYRRREEAAQGVVREIEARGRRSRALPMDAGSPEAIRAAFEKARTGLGPIEVLVNNAGMIQEKPFEDLEVEDWDRMHAVNLRGPFLCSQQVLGPMRARGFGRIVNLGSIGGQWGGTRQVHYAAAKAGLIGLTRSLARLGADRGVTVNAVAPGLVQTEMIADELADPAGRAKLAAIPLGRVATPEEIAGAVVFLTSEEAAYLTGQTLSVNGGMLFR